MAAGKAVGACALEADGRHVDGRARLEDHVAAGSKPAAGDAHGAGRIKQQAPPRLDAIKAHEQLRKYHNQTEERDSR